MTLQTIRLDLCGRRDARLAGRLSLYLLTVAAFISVTEVGGQYISGNNYQSGSIGVIDDESYLNAADLAILSRSQSQWPRQEETDTVGEDGLSNSLINRWLDSERRPMLKIKRHAAQQVDPNSLIGTDGVDLMEGGDELFDYYNNLLNKDARRSGIDDSWVASRDVNDAVGELADPVNDPDEFEPMLGHPTDAPNDDMGNMHARKRLLVGLLNSTSSPSRAQLVLAGKQAGGEPKRADLINELRNQLQMKLAELKGWPEDVIDEQQQQMDDDTDNRDNSPKSLSSPPLVLRDGVSEYIDRPLALVGHHNVQGGAGEGHQLLGPEGTFENVQVIKEDIAVPSYCNPPNPCPIGYTARNGCLENFVNSASYSREYQIEQKCSCDDEHSLFQCS